MKTETVFFLEPGLIFFCCIIRTCIVADRIIYVKLRAEIGFSTIKSN